MIEEKTKANTPNVFISKINLRYYISNNKKKIVNKNVYKYINKKQLSKKQNHHDVWYYKSFN